MHQTTITGFFVAALCAGAATVSTAAEPRTGGPEAVADWKAGGEQFIADAKKLLPNTGRAKNVILFVGDGMGISTITAARILEGQMRGRTGEENRLFFETLPYAALSKTYSWDQQTPDSAPTMTAMVTGYKTREDQLSVDHTTARGECDARVIAARALPTILEQAAAAGKATGIVTTTRITHATPAATYAHTAMRNLEYDGQVASAPTCAGLATPVSDIARQLMEVSPVVRRSLRVALGGGRDYFRHTGQTDPEYGGRMGLRTDGRDLTAEWTDSRGAGSAFVWNRAGFDAIDPAGTRYLLGLFERSHMQYESDRAGDAGGEPSLADMTGKAIALLQQEPAGFFLHVEGGRIDHAHHAGNARRALIETIEFARAVRRAREMTDPKDTLIIVTADHSHTFTLAGYPHRGNDILGLVRPVPKVDGQNPAPALAADGMPYTTLGYANGPGAVNGARSNPGSVDTTAPDYRQQATVPFRGDAETHGGEDVAIFASGPMAHLVHGSMEQNWIYYVMKEAFGF